jgi:hypothetical protein
MCNIIFSQTYACWLKTMFDLPFNPEGKSIETSAIHPFGQFPKYQWFRHPYLSPLTISKLLSYLAMNFLLLNKKTAT